jgi:acyl-CoA thioester hydrolase
MNYNYQNTIQLRVRYGETDQMGYCYYGNYAQYFEVGRVEALRSLGMSYKSLENNGIMLPVLDFSIHYNSPALYDDLLTITTTIVKIEGAKLFFTYSIHNESTQLICTAATTLVFINKENNKPFKAPISFIQLLHNYSND